MADPLSFGTKESHGCELYLKYMNLTGFKSFAERTRLEFEPGVSVVVGPNGVGKSNLVDAVAWVLGSQYTRALRTDRMDDVIFAGTATRPRHARAEVTVVFDNSRRLLPLELDEVSLTRRLFRAGLSQYEINGVQCRLLDVQELLSDSGVGRHQHLIVGQGRLDSLLTADGERRRRIIEEAAGILKHRLRKERAIRRLEETYRDVTRLHDVVREIERRRRPLRRQLAAAQRYELVCNELRALRLWLGGESLRASGHRLRKLELEKTLLRMNTEAERAELSKHKETLCAMSTDRARSGEALDSASTSRTRLESVSTRLQGIAEVARERVSGLSLRIEGARERRMKLEGEAERLEGRLVEAAEREREVRRAVQTAQADLDLHSERLGSLTPDQPDPSESELAALRIEIRSLEAAVHRDRGARTNLVMLVEEAKVRGAEDTDSLSVLEEELDATAARLEASRRAADAGAAARSGLDAALKRTERKLGAATARRMEARAKMQGLEGRGASSGGGTPNGFKDWGGVQGKLTGLLDLPDRLVSAVEAALGSWVDGLVLDNQEAIREAIVRLEAEGRVDMPLLHGEAPPDRVRSRSAARDAGGESLIYALGHSAHRNLASHLLGDVVLVDDWETGLETVRANPEVRAVTPDGRLITAFGICPIQPGRVSSSTLESARRELESARAAEAEANRIESATAARLEKARQAEETVKKEFALVRGERARIVAEIERTRRSIASTRRDMARLEERLENVDLAVMDQERRRGELSRRAASLEEGSQSRREAHRRLRAQRSVIEAERRSAALARDDAIRRLGAATERQRFLATRIKGVRAELDQPGDLTADSRELQAARRVERLAGRTIRVIADKVSELDGRIKGLRGEVARSDVSIVETRRAMSELERSIEDSVARSGALAVDEAELRIREETLLEGLRRDADATKEDALAAAPPPTTTDDHRERAASLAAELSRLGPVNLLAAEEFHELDERYRLIHEQLADLERSRAELGKVIKVLDDEMAQRFSSTFEEVARHYIGFFAELFPGGTGRLTLTDTENPLTAGVEIEAQPLGKKVGKLALLSGGERSLAALAFLFAVFKARPGPFYILDEVDAALDDANLRRFLRLVDEFREQAQLIVITHQQVTVRAADVLYGVTMEPGGSSQALIHRMEETPVPA